MPMSEIDYLSDFREGKRIKALSKYITSQVDRNINIMEICGGHTYTIMKYGLIQVLPPEINFIHGPGCPVCIMPKERIDHAIVLAQNKENIIVTLGDLIRVPGSQSSLQMERAGGNDIRVVYSPLDTIKIAKENPNKRVIYFAIGFETTTPMTASLIEHVLKERIKNIFVHVNHVLVPPAVRAIMDSGDSKIEAFIGPSHVSVIAGAKIYQEIVDRCGTPVVVTGFEAVDVMDGVMRIVRQLKEGKKEVEIQYTRAVTWEGNTKAQKCIDRYLETRDTFRWRGIGDIPESALKLKDEYSFLDAEKVFADYLPAKPIDDHKLCICGEIMKGNKSPFDCTMFGTSCTPHKPMGACMVSSEGACSAYYRYGRL
jgi:hydrogenase expression/formation protein HypD